MERKRKMILKLSAKCSDLFFAQVFDEQGQQLGRDYDGYVPAFMPGDHCGDYVQLEIDTKTGQILNWKQPTRTALTKTFGPLKVEDSDNG